MNSNGDRQLRNDEARYGWSVEAIDKCKMFAYDDGAGCVSQ